MKKAATTLRSLLICLIALLPFSSQAVAEQNVPKQLPLEDVQRFTTAISQIKHYYVKDTKDKTLFENAIKGMLEGLDPHSTYLDEEAYKELHSTTKGEFSGLGIEVTMENGLIKVITPIDDTPAYRAGVKTGDFIVRLNEKPVKGMTLRDAVKLMRGKKGSEITLTILRKGENKPLEITVTRDLIHIKSVKSKILEGHYGYIRITHFQSPTAEDFKKAVQSLRAKTDGKLSGLILDLRNNPGGLLSSAIKISDQLIHNDNKGEEEMIVITKGRIKGAAFQAKATPGDLLKGAPIVVLINEGSASGSEIVAGALKDNKRAILLGTKSFGKGSVQTVLPLDGKRGIKLTTALYYTPAGTSIQATGIVPDIVIKNLDVPKKKDNSKLFESLKESDLTGHLDNGNGTTTAKKKSAVDKELVHTDFQLYEALNVLKGLELYRQQKR